MTRVRLVLHHRKGCFLDIRGTQDLLSDLQDSVACPSHEMRLSLFHTFCIWDLGESRAEMVSLSLLAGTKETLRWSSRIQEGVIRVCATGKKARREKSK